MDYECFLCSLLVFDACIRFRICSAHDEYDSRTGEGLGHGKMGEVLNELAGLVKDCTSVVV